MGKWEWSSIRLGCSRGKGEEGLGTMVNLYSRELRSGGDNFESRVKCILRTVSLWRHAPGKYLEGLKFPYRQARSAAPSYQPLSRVEPLVRSSAILFPRPDDLHMDLHP